MGGEGSGLKGDNEDIDQGGGGRQQDKSKRERERDDKLQGRRTRGVQERR